MPEKLIFSFSNQLIVFKLLFRLELMESVTIVRPVKFIFRSLGAFADGHIWFLYDVNIIRVHVIVEDFHFPCRNFPI